jgi:adenine phosphoribosyltransferase
MNKEQIAYLETFVKTYENFPGEGVSFKDLSLLYSDPAARRIIKRHFGDLFNYTSNDPCVIGCDARGFIIGTMIADELNLPFVMARKPGKLPGDVLEQAYGLEYGQSTLQIHKHVIQPYRSAIIADDVLATGGTCLAVTKMLNRIGIQDIHYAFIMEIEGLNGRDRIAEAHGVNMNNKIFSVLKTA